MINSVPQWWRFKQPFTESMYNFSTSWLFLASIAIIFSSFGTWLAGSNLKLSLRKTPMYKETLSKDLNVKHKWNNDNSGHLKFLVLKWNHLLIQSDIIGQIFPSLFILYMWNVKFEQQWMEKGWIIGEILCSLYPKEMVMGLLWNNLDLWALSSCISKLNHLFRHRILKYPIRIFKNHINW